MAKIPALLSWVRPLVHKTRYLIHAVIGSDPRSRRTFDATSFSSTLLRLNDRLSNIESTLNWRLYGLPPRVCNIKLEQAQLMAGSGDVENALGLLRAHSPLNGTAIPELGMSQAGKVYIFPGIGCEEYKQIHSQVPAGTHMSVFNDTSDLYNFDGNAMPEENENVSVISAPLSTAAARLQGPEFNYIWMSSVGERMTPLQLVIFLKRAHDALLTGGKCSGYFIECDATNWSEYWLDPRRLRPLSQKFIKELATMADFKKVVLTQKENNKIFFTLAKD